MTSLLIGGVIAAGFLAVSRPALAQTDTIYFDNFNGTSGDLSGTTPTITTGGATWQSSTGLFTETPSGSAAPGTVTDTSNASASGPSAFLPFTVASLNSAFPQGAIIDLSVTLNPTTELNPSNATTKTDWLSFGFSNLASTTSDPSQGAVNAGPWLLYRINGGVQLFQGPSTGNSDTPTATFSGPTRFDIVLNTATNTESFYGGGTNTTPFFTTTATADPFSSINFVTIGARHANGTFASFSLTATSATPEPGAIGLALAGLPLLGATLRRRRA